MRYYATLGYKPGVLLDLRDFVSDRPAVTIFHGDLNPTQARALERAKILLAELEIGAEFVEIQKPWNLEDCLSAFLAAWKKHGRPSDILVNASGGTEVLNAAATIFCMFAKGRARYWDRRRGLPTPVDFGMLVSAWTVTPQGQRLLGIMAEQGGSLPLQAVAKKLGITPGGVTKLVKQMVGANLVVLSRKSRGRGKTVTFSAALWPLITVADPTFRISGPRRSTT